MTDGQKRGQKKGLDGQMDRLKSEWTGCSLRREDCYKLGVLLETDTD